MTAEEERVLELCDMSYEQAAGVVAEFDRLRAELDRHRVAGDAMAEGIRGAAVSSGTPAITKRVLDAEKAWRSVRGDAPAAPAAAPLPVTLSSVDDVATVCLARGLTTLDEGRAWQTQQVLVMTDHDVVDGRLNSYCVYRPGNDEPMVAIQPHAPSAVLVAAIAAAQGESPACPAAAPTDGQAPADALDPLAHVQLGHAADDMLCGAQHGPWSCTRDVQHPGQHIAAIGYGQRVGAVWPAAPADDTAAPDLVEQHQEGQPGTPFAIQFDGTWDSVNRWLTWLGHDEDGDDSTGGPAVSMRGDRLVLEADLDGEQRVIEPGGWLVCVGEGEWVAGLMLTPGYHGDVGSAGTESASEAEEDVHAWLWTCAAVFGLTDRDDIGKRLVRQLSVLRDRGLLTPDADAAQPVRDSQPEATDG